MVVVPGVVVPVVVVPGVVVPVVVVPGVVVPGVVEVPLFSNLLSRGFDPLINGIVVKLLGCVIVPLVVWLMGAVWV